jgi:hypothetical protein
MKYNFILDYESIGNFVFDCPVINCAYFVFDWERFTSDNPYTFEELIESIKMDKFDLEDQKKYGYKPKQENIDWWMGQSKEARKQLFPSDKDITQKQFVSNITNYLTPYKIDCWWSRANCFDPVLLQRQFVDVSSNEDLNKLLKFWKMRDIRTYIDTRFNFENKKNGFCPEEDEKAWDAKFILHNSIHDVAADILRLQRIERLIHT